MKRRSTVLFVVAGSLLASAGCGGMSEEDAREMWSSLEGSLASGGSGAGQTSQALTVDVDFSAECDQGGTMRFSGELDQDTDVSTGGVQTASTFQYVVVYEACSDGENTLDGTVTWTSSQSTDASNGGAEVLVLYTYEGAITSSGEANGACDFDVEGRVEVSAGTGGVAVDVTQSGDADYSGTLCGHDADVVLDASVSAGDA